jgi:hypothetical protein
VIIFHARCCRLQPITASLYATTTLTPVPLTETTCVLLGIFNVLFVRVMVAGTLFRDRPPAGVNSRRGLRLRVAIDSAQKPSRSQYE